MSVFVGLVRFNSNVVVVAYYSQVVSAATHESSAESQESGRMSSH